MKKVKQSELIEVWENNKLILKVTCVIRDELCKCTDVVVSSIVSLLFNLHLITYYFSNFTHFSLLRCQNRFCVHLQ